MPYMIVLCALGLIAALDYADEPHGNSGSLDFTCPPKWAGRPLTETERTTVRRAIDSIATPPPSAITYSDSSGNVRTMSCADIAANLLRQLNRGGIEAETLNTGDAGETFYGGTLSDGLPTTEGDKLNLDVMLMEGAAEDPSILRYLEVILLHEHTHKTQTITGTTSNAREIEAFAAGLAYMDSLGFPADDGMRQESFETWQKRKQGTHHHARIPLLQSEGASCAFIHFDTTGTGPSYLATFHLGQIHWQQCSLGSWRPADMMLFSRNTPLPTGHFLAVVCGGDGTQGVARMTAYDIFQDQVAGTFVSHSFGPPSFPPMFFSSMTRCPQTGLYFVLDSLNGQIRVLSDNNQDMVGDAILSVYADAGWDGFEDLAGMRGVDLVTHLYGGQVPVVNHTEAHLPHNLDPFALYWCLPDMNGDRVANLCAPIHGYEFLIFSPVIQTPLPVAGDQTVQVFATWSHSINVWQTDASGQTLINLLGSVTMQPAVDAVCELTRALGEGEYIVPVDQNNGMRPMTPVRVGGTSGSGNGGTTLPDQLSLAPPYPNPFNASTTIVYDLPKAGRVSLRVFDLLGHDIAVLTDGFTEAGSHRVKFDGSGLASGIYFTRLDAGDFSQTKKLMLLK